MLLSYHELVKLVDSGMIDAAPENINGASIDLTLDKTLLCEVRPSSKYQWHLDPIDLINKKMPNLYSVEIPEDDGYELCPGEFVLANTRETFHLPNDIAAEFKLKSSVARAGLNHLLAGFADPGWHNAKLTLELVNTLRFHKILLREGMKIGQMIFYRVSPVDQEQSYAIRGRYNNTQLVTASQGV